MPLLIRGHKELNDWARAVPSFFWTECPVTPLCTQRFICKFISSFVNTSVACWNMRFVPGVKHGQRLNSKEKGTEVKSPVSLPWQWVVCVWGARVAVLGQGEFGVEQSSLLGWIWQRWCQSPHAQELPHPWSCCLTVELQQFGLDCFWLILPSWAQLSWWHRKVLMAYVPQGTGL